MDHGSYALGIITGLAMAAAYALVDLRGRRAELLILRHLVTAPAGVPQCSLLICRGTGLGAGRLYPALDHLLTRRLVFRVVDDAGRTYYDLTPAGADRAHVAAEVAP